MANTQKSIVPSRARLMFEPTELHYNFGPGHPLQPSRIEALIDLLKETNLWQYENEQTRLPLRSATLEELHLVHTQQYVQAVQTLSAPEAKNISKEEREERTSIALKYGFGDGDTPALPGMHEVTANIAGRHSCGVKRGNGVARRRAICHRRGTAPTCISSLWRSASCMG